LLPKDALADVYNVPTTPTLAKPFTRDLRPRMRDGALVGALLSAPLIAASYLGWKLGGLPFVPFDLFDWIARELPGSVVTIGIDSAVTILRALHAGSVAGAAKSAEQTLAIAAFFAAGVFAGSLLFGVLRLSDEPALLFGAILGALQGGSALVVEQRLRRIESFVDAWWIVGMFLAWGLAFGWVHDRLREANADRPGSRLVADGRFDRRGVLIRLAWAAAVPTLFSAAWALVTGGRRAGGAGVRWSDGHSLPNAGALVTPVPGTRAELTPLEDHYRVDADTRAPVIDERRWRLRIGGLVERPLELTLDDLRREEPLHQFVTLSCVSNPIGADLIGTTRWSGVSLQRLLRRFTLRPGATHLRISSADGFFEVVSLETIENDARVMLAYAWDGVPLHTEHGFPLRIYVPDVYGMKQPKWIEAIDVIDRWEPGYWVVRGWDREGRMTATSVVDAVVGTAAPDASGRRIASAGGIAHAGARGISRVEVQVDDGEWRGARLRDPLSETTWVIWRADLPSTAGDHLVTVRSYQRDGTSQTGALHSKRAKLS
jgi:DMSO/TMAO reductase YedYZ molybdopterin-dependent catalytic subunit